MSKVRFEVPIVCLIFNRPDTTQAVFRVLKELRPSQLFLVGDGPRSDKVGETDKCQKVRDIFEKVDWDCKIQKNYSNTNLGCKKRVSSGLNWVFDHVEEAIVLEDDCLPDLSFFRFCQELLERYRDDRRIMAISGDNFQFGRSRTDYSYYFSRYPHCWGWATWRRAWHLYDEDMKMWPEIRDGGWLKDILSYMPEERYRRKVFQRAYENKIDTWSYRWTLTCWQQNGLIVLPRTNLVSNIGFNQEGTHTKNSNNPFASMKTEPMKFPLQHPPFMIRDIQADRFTYKVMFSLLIRVARRVLGMLKL